MPLAAAVTIRQAVLTAVISPRVGDRECPRALFAAVGAGNCGRVASPGVVDTDGLDGAFEAWPDLVDVAQL
jgi:hypothetical protein